MKYVLVIQGTAPALGALGFRRVQAAFLDGLGEQLLALGELVDDERLAGPEQAKIVRARGNAPPSVASAPFAEDRQFVARFWIVDCDGPERALEIAAHLSALPGPDGQPANFPVELRPVMKTPGEEM